MATIDAAEFRKNVDGTIEHTRKVLQNVLSLALEPDAFGQKYAINTSRILLSKADAEYLAVLAVIHDLWKPVTTAEHAQLGARFLEDSNNVAAVRFHERLGVIHTGEASLLFLDELAVFLARLSTDEASKLLNRLQLFTIVDVAAYGYLNQARVDTYDYLVRLLRDVRQPGDLERLARADTTRRIKRLLEANNRVRLGDDALRRACDSFQDMTVLEDLLVTCRFDYGAYSLEPFFRVLVKCGHSIEDKDVVTVEDGEPVGVFLKCLLDILYRRTAAGVSIAVTPMAVGTKSLFT